MDQNICRTRCPILLVHGTGGRGMSHMDEIDFRRRPLRGREGPVDPVDRYVELVDRLRELGL